MNVSLTHAAISTEDGLVLTADAIDPGRRYDTRLSYREAAGEVHELAGWFVAAATAQAALAGLIELEERSGGIDAAEVASLNRLLSLVSEPPVDAAVPPMPETEIAARPEERWAAAVRDAAGQSVLDDPGWPALASGLDRADASGWDVATRFPLLVQQQQLPARNPARELQYRLIADCDAATPPAAAGAPAPEPALSPAESRRRAELSLQQQPPSTGREALGR